MGNSRFFSYFKNYIGAIDGTHVSTWAPASKQTTFPICDLEMLFTFVYSGWEGTANDLRVFLDALTLEIIFQSLMEIDSNFRFPNMPGNLAPYRKERYHLSDLVMGDGHYSPLRNVIQRCFRVLKARFSILKLMPNYPARR
ncbi:hypothetical protein AHAS_Ahas16G0115400 [Arachis hypogaea]